ncbi:MAG: hypothetical protein F9K29_05730 [Hyphomicrobiaceae bacterium]|nr:MAG: hypothetical protein F9K29_05730 [Hyphomicrobiaceae bacterium]
MTYRHQGREGQERIFKFKGQSSDNGAIAAIVGAIFVALLLIAIVSPGSDVPVSAPQQVGQQGLLVW